jgi:hypothetical protein
VSPIPSVPLLPRLVGAQLLDAPLAALVWLLLERGVPVIVAGREAGAADALLDALVSALPRDRRPDSVLGGGGDRVVRVAGPLEASTPPGILRAALGTTTGRSGLAVAIAADDLAGVLAVLRGQGLTDHEIAFMGVVLVLGARGPRLDVGARGPRPDVGAPHDGRQPDDHEAARLLAAHYLRPVVLDAGGHPRRLPPAVLATWDPATDAWDDYAWGLTADLAERARMRGGDLEAERNRRAAALTEHAGGGPVG